MPKLKFALGDKVKFVGEDDKDAGEVIEFSYNAVSGARYVITSKYYDHDKRGMETGVRTALESELELIKEEGHAVH